MKRALTITIVLTMVIVILSACMSPQNSLISGAEQSTTSDQSTSGEQQKISMYLKQENDTYMLTLPESGQTIEVDKNEICYDYVSYISDELLKEAERKLSEKVAEYTNNSGFYLYVNDEGYLCLAVEIIKKIDPPNTSVEGDAGCGVDHEHYFYYESISNQPHKQ